MKRRLLQASCLAIALVSATVSSTAFAAKSTKGDASVIARVNGKSIPKSRADSIVAAQVAQGQPDSEDLRKIVREELVRREVLIQEGQKKGIDKKTEVQNQLDIARQSVLVGAYIGDFLKNNPVSEDAIKKEFDAIMKALGDKEYKARHVLVEKEDEAKAIIERLNKGEKIEDLAKESKDPGSKERGGDLGWASAGNYVKTFADAMSKLEKGKFTTAPVKSDFGWHVILLEDTRELKAPALDEVKPALAQRLHQQMLEKHISDLRAKAKVE